MGVNADSLKPSSPSKQRMNAWQVTFIRNWERATGQKSNIRTKPSKKELQQSQILGGAGYVLHLCDLNLKAASMQEFPHCVYRTGLEMVPNYLSGEPGQLTGWITWKSTKQHGDRLRAAPHKLLHFSLLGFFLLFLMRLRVTS